MTSDAIPEPAAPEAADETAARFPVTDAELTALHDRLTAAAETEQLVDIAYRTVDTPVGPLLLAATSRGLVRVAYEREGFDAVLESLSRALSPRILRAPRRVDTAATQLEEYFARGRRTFALPLDHALSRGFRAAVQALLPGIDYGTTSTYRQLAELAGSPGAVRAVGTACATNPLPIVVPCHRVLRSDGGLGGYIGGLEAKEHLLELERAQAGAR